MKATLKHGGTFGCEPMERGWIPDDFSKTLKGQHVADRFVYTVDLDDRSELKSATERLLGRGNEGQSFGGFSMYVESVRSLGT